MSLSPDVSSWIASVAGSMVTTVTRYERANTASVYRTDLETGVSLVLKCYDIDDPYDRREHRCAHEAAVLDWLAGNDVPVPDVVGRDVDGSVAGAPLLLMSHVRGVSELPARWQGPLAALVVSIHETNPGPVDWDFVPYWATVDLETPDWALDRGLWRAVFDAVRADAPGTRRGFIHRDLHPGNVLWSDGGISGVIDWMQACVGPQGLDVAHCRANLVMDHGFAAGDEFLTAYLETAAESQWHPYWDLVDAIDFLPFLLGSEAVQRWSWDDRPAALTRGRMETYLRSALVTLDQIG